MKRNVRFISVDRIKILHDSISFLETYQPSINTIDVVGSSTKKIDRDIHLTKLLNKLGKINKVRENIIKELTSKN